MHILTQCACVHVYVAYIYSIVLYTGIVPPASTYNKEIHNVHMIIDNNTHAHTIHRLPCIHVPLEVVFL